MSLKNEYKISKYSCGIVREKLRFNPRSYKRNWKKWSWKETMQD